MWASIQGPLPGGGALSVRPRGFVASSMRFAIRATLPDVCGARFARSSSIWPPSAKELGGRRFGAEEAVGWAVSRQLLEPGQRAPRSQSETRVPLRPDAIDRTVRLTARAPPPLSTETPTAERSHRGSDGRPTPREPTRQR